MIHCVSCNKRKILREYHARDVVTLIRDHYNRYLTRKLLKLSIVTLINPKLRNTSGTHPKKRRKRLVHNIY